MRASARWAWVRYTLLRVGIPWVLPRVPLDGLLAWLSGGRPSASPGDPMASPARTSAADLTPPDTRNPVGSVRRASRASGASRAQAATAPGPSAAPWQEGAWRRAEWVLGRFPGVENTCFYRALARYGTLRNLGLPVTFVMGVRPEGSPSGQWPGHAWLEWNGEVFGEVLEQPFLKTFCYPPTTGESVGVQA